MPRFGAVLAAVAIFQVLGTATAGAVAPVAAVSPARPPTEPSANFAACLDGTCTVTISGRVEIPLDGRAGFTALSVLDIGSSVTLSPRSKNGTSTSRATVSSGGTARFGNGSGTLTVHVLEISRGTVRLEITTTGRRPGRAE